MKEIETLTYNFSVSAIGFAKSIEKTNSENETISNFKEKAGSISLQFMKAFDIDGNKEFADCIRNSYEASLDTKKLLQCITIEADDQQLDTQKEKLGHEIDVIISKLEDVLKKIIY